MLGRPGTLSGHDVPRGQAALLPGADALAHPHRVRPQHAPQLARSWQVGTIPGAQSEILRLAGQEAVEVADRGPALRTVSPGRCDLALAGRRITTLTRRTWPGIGQLAASTRLGFRKAVVRVGPDGRLLRIDPRSGQALGELRELMAAPLTDRGERHRVPGEVQSDLIRLTGTIAAANGDY